MKNTTCTCDPIEMCAACMAEAGITPMTPEQEDALDAAVCDPGLGAGSASRDTESTSATSDKKENEMTCHLRDEFYLIIPKVTDARDFTAIKTRLIDGPVALAIRGGGHLTLAGYQIPIRDVSLDSLSIERVTITDDPEVTEIAVAIRLPDDLARVQAAFERSERAWDKEDVQYNWQAFFTSYRNDLGKAASVLIKDWVMATRMNGFMAQAVSDIRLNDDEVGVGPETAKKLQRLLAREVDPKIASLDSIDGLYVILERFPTASEAGAKWSVLRILHDRPEGQTFVSPWVWQVLQGGDEDGDLAHVGQTGEWRIAPSRDLGPFPSLEFYDGSSLLEALVPGYTPVTPESSVGRVMGMCIKDLTGLLHHVWHSVARSAAVAHARKYECGEHKTRIKNVYTGIFNDLFFGQLENVMDARKVDDLTNLFGLAEGLSDAAMGGTLKPSYFAPFVEVEKRGILVGTLNLAGSSLQATRDTAFGRLVAAGRKLPERTVKLIATLQRKEIAVENMIERLQRDALGEQLICLNRPKKQVGDEEEGGAELLHEARSKEWEVTGEFTITWRGKIVCQLVRDEKEEKSGNRVVTLRITPHWRVAQKEMPVWTVRLTMPEVQPHLKGGHAKIWMGGSERFYRPVFALDNGSVVKWSFDRYLTQSIKDEIAEIVKAKGKMTQIRCGSKLTDAIRNAVTKLTLSTPRENLVRQFQYQVFVPKGPVQDEWTERELILSYLSTQGFDVLSTSKNKPGSYVMKSNTLGVPSYLLAINPFALYLDGKRRVEPMEIRAGLDLFAPKPLRVSAIEMPEGFKNAITELTVAIFDCNLNMFDARKEVVDPETGEVKGTRFCHDTLIACPSIEEKIALARLEFKCEDQKECDEIVARLMDRGYGIDAIDVDEVPKSLGTGMQVIQFVIRVECKIDDIGKIKSCIGPIKGVPNVIPTQLYANGEAIDLVIPRDTVLRKKALDLVLYILAAKAGIEQIDPRLSLEELVKLLPNEELSEVKDGEGNVLGRALVGPCPFFRPSQTGLTQYKMRGGRNGVRIHAHAMIMAGVNYDTPEYVNRDFVQTVTIMQEVESLIRGSDAVMNEVYA